MTNGKIGVTTENIFPVIKKFLYSEHEIFLRELISNAVDATQKLKTLSSIGEAKGELGDLTIHVAVDKEKKTLTVTDRGVGIPDIAKAMEPMFTTGDAEERAGLGFAVMQSFMDKVKVSSTPGRGTRVTLTKRLDARA